jgi:hypothetical protein
MCIPIRNLELLLLNNLLLLAKALIVHGSQTERPREAGHASGRGRRGARRDMLRQGEETPCTYSRALVSSSALKLWSWTRPAMFLSIVTALSPLPGGKKPLKWSAKDSIASCLFSIAE